MTPPGNPVAELTDYELRHLVAHLAALGRTEDVHHLLRLAHGDGDRRVNAWFARKRERLEFDAYLEDVAAGWRLADAAGSEPGAVVLQAEYALIAASVSTLVGLMPVSRLARLSASGTVAASQALALAGRYSDPRERVGALIALVSELDGGPRLAAAAAVLDSIPALSNPLDRARAMGRLAPNLPPELAPRALALARRFAAHDEGYLLPRVAPGLPAAELEALLCEVTARDQGATRDEELLATLLERLAELGDSERALELADELLQGDRRRLELRYAQAAAAILAHLPLEAARALAARLAALEQGGGSPPSMWRTAWSRRLMREGERDLAVATVSDIADARFRFGGLAEVLDDATDGRDRVRLIALMVAALRDPEAAGADVEGAARHVKRALRDADPLTRTRMRARLARAPKLLAAVVFADRGTDAADPIGPSLGGGYPGLGWSRARDQRRRDLRRTELDAVEAARAQLTQATAESQRSAGAQTWSLRTVDPTWDWAAIDAPGDDADAARADDLAALSTELAQARRLPEVPGVGVGESLWGASMEQAGRATVFMERPRAMAQVDVIGRMAAAGAADAALAGLAEVDDAFWRGLALARIAPALPARVLDAALEAARGLPPMYGGGGSDGDSRTAALHVIARVLARDGRGTDASSVADELAHAPARRATRAALAARLAELPAPQLVGTWQRALHALANEPRVDVVRELAALAPVLAAVGGPAAGRELADRIAGVTTQWPLDEIVADG